MSIPSKKDALINQAHKEVMEVHQQYGDGLITNGERYNKVIDIWAKVTERVAHEMMGELGAESEEKIEQEEKRSFNSIFMMADSGARGERTADSAARRDAGADGQAFGRDHRDSDHGELPRGPHGPPVLHLDARSAEGSRRHGA